MFRMIATFVGIPLRGRSAGVLTSAWMCRALLEAIRRTRDLPLTFLAYPEQSDRQSVRCCARSERVTEAIAGTGGGRRGLSRFRGQELRAASSRAIPNLLVMRTLSKLGLAGLRLGLLIGRPEWLTELDKLRLPYNVNVLTQLSGGTGVGAAVTCWRRKPRPSERERARLLATLAVRSRCARVPERREFHIVPRARDAKPCLRL